MRVALLVHHFPPDVNSTGRLMSRLTSAFREDGHEVTVITSFPHYEGFRIWPPYRRKLFQRDRVDGVDIWRVWCFARGRKSMRNRLINYVTFNIMAAVVGLRIIPRADVVLATNGSFFSGLSAWISGRGRVPFVYNVQDLYPEVPILAGQLRNPAAIALLRRTAHLMYARASFVTVIAPSFRTYLHDKNGVALQKVKVIPNFVDTDLIRPLPRNNEYAVRMGFADRFMVAHSGNLGYAYDLMTLMDAARLLADQHDIRFVIIGNGVMKQQLVSKAQSLRLDNVSFLGFQPENELPWMRASMDVHLALYIPSAARYSMPSKVYEIMASGRPVLASADPGSDVRQLVEGTGAGICVNPLQPEALAEAIVRLRDRPADRQDMGLLGRRYVEGNHTVAHIASEYEHLLSEAIALR